MGEKLTNFLIFTNPLTWVYFIILVIYYLLNMFCSFIGLNDWYYILFKVHKMDEDHKKSFLQVAENKKIKLFWPKEQAWKYAIKKLNKGDNDTYW